MGLIDRLYSLGAVRPRKSPGALVPGGDPADLEKFVYITPQSLTFPGVTIAAGIAATLLSKALDVKSPPNLALSAAVGLVIGGLLTWLSIAKATEAQRRKRGFIPQAVLIALLNTTLLIASVHGVAEVTTGSNSTTTTTTTSTTSTSAPS